MSEIVGYRGKWNELGKELEDIVKKNNSLPKDKKKSLNKLFEEFAETHDTTPNSTSRYYYNEIKNKIDDNPSKEKKVINIDESINNHAHSVHTDLKDPRTFYRVGDILEAEVSSIHDFGVFTKTKEGFEGLIHKSEITGRQYVEMPEDFFYIGEKVRVKVKSINSEGKIAFSTRMLGGKEKINPAFADIAKVNIAKPETRIPKVIEQPKTAKIESAPAVEAKQKNHPDDRDNIINFIKKYSDNNVSQKALADIDEMVAKHGVFQTTISLMETVRDLDISSFITNLTKEKLGLAGDLLRRS